MTDPQTPAGNARCPTCGAPRAPRDTTGGKGPPDLIAAEAAHWYQAYVPGTGQPWHPGHGADDPAVIGALCSALAKREMREMCNRDLPGQPLWRQVAADLRQTIAERTFEGRLPPAAEIAADYCVSATTMRRALRDLAAEGIIAALPGGGRAWYVTRRPGGGE